MEPQKFQDTFKRIEAEIRKVIVGHDDAIRKVLIAFFAGGHADMLVIRSVQAGASGLMRLRPIARWR